MEKARGFQKNIYLCFIDYAKAFDCVDHNKLWKILQEVGIPDHLTCFLINLYVGHIRLVKAMVFPVVLCRGESWTIKRAKCWRIDAFDLWCWRRLLRVPCTARRSNQSILKEISPEYSFQGLMLKLKLQYFGHLMWRNWLTGKNPDAGKDWRQEEKEKGMMEDEIVGWHHWLDGHEFKQALGVGDGQGSLECCSPWGCKELERTEQLNNNNNIYVYICGMFHSRNVTDEYRRLLAFKKDTPDLCVSPNQQIPTLAHNFSHNGAWEWREEWSCSQTQITSSWSRSFSS